MTTMTYTASNTFSLANARFVGSKVATDLKQMQRYYGKPADVAITMFEEEVAVLMYHRAIGKVIYGFRRNGSWILTLEYTAVNGTLVSDDRAGGIYRYADVSGADFYSFLTYSGEWERMNAAGQAEIESKLPFGRGTGQPPSYTGGRHINDRTFSANGTGLTRSSYQPL